MEKNNMEILKVKLNNNYEFEADSVSETHNISGNIKSININVMFKGDEYIDKLPEITENITIGNMSSFTVSIDGKEFYEYTGYTDNLMINININKQGQSLYIIANK